MGEFLAMGGYGAYVWSAYALAVVVLVANVVVPRHCEKATLARLAGRTDAQGRV